MIKKLNILPWLPAVVWMILIFSLSAQPAASSNNLSKGVTKIIVEVVGRILPLDIEMSTVNDIVSQFNHFVRKFAHFFAYAVLGFLVAFAFSKSGVQGRRAFLLSLMVCVTYAASDEVHQLFVPGRGCQIKDVMIDSAGSAVGIAVQRAIHNFKNKTYQKTKY